MSTFPGFPAETFTFLAALGDDANNHKAWFDDHRADYEEYFLAPAQSLVGALGERLQTLSPRIRAVPKVQGGSIFRINRDTRFGKDKRPYKDNLDLWFWVGEGPSRECPGLGVRITATSVATGGGRHGFDPDGLAAYRSAVLDDRRGEDLAGIVRPLVAEGAHQMSLRKTVPRGFDKDHPRADLLARDGLWLGFDDPDPAWVRTPSAVDELADRLGRVWPIVEWLAH